MTTSRILVCTVGGSHQPIVSAIQALAADYVCFICSEADAATGKPGSEVQVRGKGLIIKNNHNDEKPSLPNIPSQCGLADDHYELRLVPADDLDAVYAICRDALTELRERHPHAAIHADYTGGTKTMTAGLVLAAIEDDQVELQLVTGSRVDLLRVPSGHESAVPANIETIRLQGEMRPYLDAWSRFAYAEAEAGLRTLPAPRNSDLRGHLNRARDLSAAFAAWDRFDHEGARQTIQGYASKLSSEHSEFLGVLRSLIDGDLAKRQAAQLLDLFRNAERRAAQGRYDDAVARLYRLLEWTAQWSLERHCQVKTSDLPDEFAPDISPNRDGKRQAGLFQAWQLVGKRTEGPLAQFIGANEARLRDYLLVRNTSILAHGSEPISQQDWTAFYRWASSSFMPELLNETISVGIRRIPPQLPDSYPFS